MATTRLHIGPADHGRRLTLEEFRDAEEEPGYCYELARGVLDVTEVPNDSHWQIVDNLHEALSAYRRRHPGRVVRVGHGSDVRFVIPEANSDRHPDLAVVLAGAGSDSRGRLRAGLAVEVVSPGAESRRRDYEEKRDDYLAYGLREYWVVDPDRREVTVLVRRDDPPSWSEQVYRGADVIVSPLLPGFAGTVTESWADAGEAEGPPL